MARVYLHAWQVTGNEFFRTITEEVLDDAAREMLNLEAGFYSTQDADPTSLGSGDRRSEGERGKFLVWIPDEMQEALGDETELFMEACGVTRCSNASTGSAHGFEGKNILEYKGHLSQRDHPGRDAQVLTACYGLMLATFGEDVRAFSPSPRGESEGARPWGCV